MRFWGEGGERECIEHYYIDAEIDPNTSTLPVSLNVIVEGEARVGAFECEAGALLDGDLAAVAAYVEGGWAVRPLDSLFRGFKVRGFGLSLRTVLICRRVNF